MNQLLWLACITGPLAAISFWWPPYRPLTMFLCWITAIALGVYIEERFGG